MLVCVVISMLLFTMGNIWFVAEINEQQGVLRDEKLQRTHLKNIPLLFT